MKKLIFFCVFISVNILVGQEHTPPKVKKDSTELDSINKGLKAAMHKDSVNKEFFVLGDSIPREFIGLDEVLILSELEFDNDLEERKYHIVKRKTIKVYPYAKLAAERLVELNNRLDKLDSRGERRRYTKIVQEYIEDEFTEELKKLTRTEGQILVKLIHRQTGITTYELVRELKSGWRAFWYNTTASLFDISLKEEFHPESNKEDFWIEDVLQRAFQEGRLEEQPTALNFDFLELTNKWSN